MSEANQCDENPSRMMDKEQTEDTQLISDNQQKCPTDQLNKTASTVHVLDVTENDPILEDEANKAAYSRSGRSQNELVITDARHCTSYSKSLSTGGKLGRSHFGKSNTGEGPYRCAECDKVFSSGRGLRKHRPIHSGLRPYVSDQCDKRFPGLDSLRKHQSFHTVELSHACSQCGKTFQDKWGLRRHMRTHTRVRPFASTECTASFSYSDSVKKHT